ncbi:tail terminator [Gordonia phage VanLee]|uniref:Tail terminator n=1 Tax=Gordonia phage VanLee TaxID=2845816 RepID=A0A8F2IF59_9CAUD|nr:tail terminator [Gordonia phage VanLee]QWS68131.1 tail terminator [Gordonia phage VanLee]
MTTGAFPDSEDVMCDLAELVVGVGKAYNELPPNLADQLPIAWCFKIGGTCDGITDLANLQTNVIAETRTQALGISNRLREVVLDAGGRKIKGVLIDATEEKNGIRLQPAPAPKQPMIVATYQLAFRRQPPR